MLKKIDFGNSLLKKKAIVLFLRIVTLGIKSLFFSIFLPRYMSISNYGKLNFITTTVIFFMFFIGFDFYRYLHRDLLDVDKGLIINRIQNHIIVSITLSLISIPIFFIVLNFLEWEFILIVWLLLVTEYLAQELYRYLILFSKPILANGTLFFRSSFWIVIFVSLFFSNRIESSIEMIIYLWLSSNLVLIASTFLFIFFKGYEPLRIKIDIEWIKKGFLVSFVFIIGSISLKTIEFSDRYLIEYFLGNRELGIYSFSSNFSNITNVFINTTIISIYYPKILNVQNTPILLKEQMRKILIEIMFVGGIVSVGIAFFYPFMVKITEKEEYIVGYAPLVFLLIGMLLYNVSIVFQLTLYCRKKDKRVMITLLISALINITANVVLIPQFGIIGAAIGTLLAFMFSLLFYLYQIFVVKIFND